MASAEPQPNNSLTTRMLEVFAAPPPVVATSIWLLQLRWVAVVGQLLTIGIAATVCDGELPVVPLLMLVGFTASTNVVYGVWLRGERDIEATHHEIPLRQAETFQGASSVGGRSIAAKQRIAEVLMVIDLVTLTAMLYFSGGVDNPFSSFFFVNLAVSGVILRPTKAWGMTGLAMLGFSSLLLSYVPLSILEAHSEDHDNTVRHLGSVIAFVASAFVVTYFVITTREELVRREQELRRVQAEQAKGQQLESLSTLAAGAAHELATPMSTVLLIAKELQHHLDGVSVPGTVREDLKLIESELRHCRAILDRMRAAAGDSAGERWRQTSVGDLVDTILEGVRDPQRVEVGEGVDANENVLLWLPCEAVSQAVRNLIHNGLDASPPSSVVSFDVETTPATVLLRVVDQGTGMSDSVLQRIGQPFFTTKEPGRGMGLGLFLSRNVIQKLGGKLEFTSQKDGGTTAVVELPRQSTGGSVANLSSSRTLGDSPKDPKLT